LSSRRMLSRSSKQKHLPENELESGPEGTCQFLGSHF
jgi:hypothetical protein